MNYAVMDTSTIVLWISVCVRNMNVRLRFDSTLKLYEKLIKVNSMHRLKWICILV